MEQLYAFGIICIEFVQEWFQDYEDYFELVNNLSNPMTISEVLVPLVSIFDSVFASQLIACLSVSCWLNALLKWWLMEDRPYWWVQESSYYSDSSRPRLLQTPQSCETGPGSPSGHTATMALVLTLLVMFAAHIAHDRKWKIPTWVTKLSIFSFGCILVSVMLARMYVAAHFPHQCLLGGIIGVFIAPVMCLCVSDPYIWGYGAQAQGSTRRGRAAHALAALAASALVALTYAALAYNRIDPQHTVRLAFRWCLNPEYIHVSTTPVFAVVQCTAYMLGAALAITPDVAKYRHDTKNRSLLISAFATALILYTYKQIDDNLCRSNTLSFYVSQYLMFAIKPMLLLRLVPALSMWPFTQKTKTE